MEEYVKLMRRFRFLLGITIILSVILGGTVFYVYNTTNELENSTKDLRSQMDSLYGFKQIGTPSISISYYFETNFSVEPYADAILNILNVSRQGYSEIFGNGGLILSSIHVFLEKNDSLTQPKLYTDGLDSIYLTVSSDDDLLSPQNRTTYSASMVYGFAHELGHIMFATDDPDFNEGWAVYTAEYQIVPYIYSTLGDGAWPNHYNYSQLEGRTRFLSIVNNESLCKPGNSYTAARILFTLDQEYGPRTIGNAVSLVKSKYSSLILSGVEPKLQYFADALVQLTNNASIPNLFAENGFLVS